jgi:hypothetical protein
MMENINTQELAAHHVSPNLIDGIPGDHPGDPERDRAQRN